ncbi:MAG: hypothetical protein ABWK01_02120 [Infirmifilum sp.]
MVAEVTRRKARGFNAERRLVKLLSSYKANRVFRVPVSGSRSFPDVFMVNNLESRIVAFEVKSTMNDKVKVRRDQLERLFAFIDAFKKYEKREAVVAVWFAKSGKWVFKKVDTPLSGDFVVTVDDETDWAMPSPYTSRGATASRAPWSSIPRGRPSAPP